MEVRELRYFAEVVDHGSFTRAAESLNISQPALTKCVRLLERRLGVTLLERGRFGVQPTPFGEVLYVRARAVCAEVERARLDVEELAGGSRASLTVGVLPSQTTGVLAEATVRLLRTRPGIRIRVIERPRIDLIPALRRGEFDFVLSIVDANTTEPGIMHRVLFHDRPKIVVRRGHPVLRLPEIRPEDLLQYPWILPRRGADHRVLVESWLVSAGISPPVEALESQSVPYTRAVIMQSDFIGILPNDAPTVEESCGLLVPVELGRNLPGRAIGILYRTDHPLTLAALALIREIRSACRREGRFGPPSATAELRPPEESSSRRPEVV